MEEKFLHYIWQHKLFKLENQEASTGEEIEIIHVGEYNTNAGPDFFNAKIKIGNTLWAGNVEIHTNSSDWHKHKHQNDKSYDSIILHVVFNKDQEIFRKNGELIPTFEIKFYKSVYDKYKALLHKNTVIKCAGSIHSIEEFHLTHWLENLAIERLNHKSVQIKKILAHNANNWEETFYQVLARAFGFKVNSYPFETLAKSLSNKILGKHKNSLFQIEALLFGQAGFLKQQSGDEYYLKLYKEYSFLSKKYDLKQIDDSLWKFLRLRPGNFPSIRIAQFASLIFESSNLFSKIINGNSYTDFEKLFDIAASNYWNEHYVFNKKTRKSSKKIGKTAFQSLMINAILPLLFVYAKSKDDQLLMQKSLDILEKIPAEKNSIISNWKEMGINIDNAFQSQAILELNNEFCKKKNCLKCQIGHQILSYKPI